VCCRCLESHGIYYFRLFYTIYSLRYSFECITEITACMVSVTPCLVIRSFLCVAGEEDGEKAAVSATDPGQQSAVPHYDVTLEGLQLALIDRHNFSGANSSKTFFNYYQIRVFYSVCSAI
jgi:hypothetical protein